MHIAKFIREGQFAWFAKGRGNPEALGKIRDFAINDEAFCARLVAGDAQCPILEFGR